MKTHHALPSRKLAHALLVAYPNLPIASPEPKGDAVIVHPLHQRAIAVAEERPEMNVLNATDVVALIYGYPVEQWLTVHLCSELGFVVMEVPPLTLLTK